MTNQIQRVRVTYTKPGNPSEHTHAYDGMTLQICGDIQTVANWMDEHIVTSRWCLAGEGNKYHQGGMVDAIKQALETRDRIDLDGGELFDVERLV